MPADIERYRTMWRMGRLRRDELPSIAVELLADHDSPALRKLAATDPSDMYEAAELFEQVLTNLALRPLSKEELLRQFVLIRSHDIASGRIEPAAGARDIWRAVVESDHRGHEYDTFGHASSELSSRPDDSGFFTAEIIKEAMRWSSSDHGNENGPVDSSQP